MTAWEPGDDWPADTAGGAVAPSWSGYVRLWVLAALNPGEPFHLGAHPNDRLDAGNVLAGVDPNPLDEIAPSLPRAADEAERLWIDLTCDVLSVEIDGGASAAQGIFSKADASTCVVTLADPEGIYDPLNPIPPWSFAGRSRLQPGTPVTVFAHVVNGDDGSLSKHVLFTGTADSWGEEWTPKPSSRTAKLVATDETKRFVRWNRPEQASQGSGEKVGARIRRIVNYFGWLGEIDAPASDGTVTLQPTTLAQSAWEMLNRTTDDELGFIAFTPDGKLRWLDRAVWFTVPDPVLVLGCESVSGGEGAHDVLVAAHPANMDAQLRNTIYAANTGGATATAASAASVAQFGQYEYKRTDLGMATDGQAAEWANAVLLLYAYPGYGVKDATAVPAVASRPWEAWASVLSLDYVSDPVRIVWAPPDHPTHVFNGVGRVVGRKHSITRGHWEVTLQLVDSGSERMAGHVFTLGPHSRDRLDANFVLGM